MKSRYCWVLMALIAGVLFFCPTQHAVAQDTLVVEWFDGLDVIKDALVIAIANDTLRPEGRVYLLKKGGYYWNRETITNPDFHLRIVGEPAGPTADENPPVLQMVYRDDASVNQRMITGQSSVTLKNLWITGADEFGVQTAYQPLQIDAQNSTFVIDNCIIDRSNFSVIAFTGGGNKIYYTNNKFRNLIGRPSTQQWEGRGISIWADQDTVIVENNTFFNCEFTALQIENGMSAYVRFNHNTMVNIGRNFIVGTWWREAYFANNLIVNGWWMGEGVSDYTSAGRDPRAYNAGHIGIGDLPSIYGPEEGRRILIANTAAWLDPYFTTAHADTIRTATFVNAVTIEDFLEPYENIVAVDTSWLTERPNMPTYPDTLRDSMWTNITDLRRSITPATPWFYELPQNLDGTECYVCVGWPLTEDFSYTTPASLLTAGTDGLPLGDLNWFPTQKADFEANKETYVAQLQALAGEIKQYDPVGNYEAEDGTLGGTAVRDTVSGFTYFDMEGGGWIQWDFDLTTAGQYDLNVHTHMNGNSIRGQRIIVNGTSIHDPRGWGEYIWDTAEGPHMGMPTNEWTWTLIIQDSILEAGALTLPAGANTIRIEASWGYQDFAQIDVIPAGTSTPAVELTAPLATYSIVEPNAEGAPYVPSQFKSVKLGTAGTITWDVVVPQNGNYNFYIFYQNYEADQTVQITVDGTPAVPGGVELVGNTDSTGLNKLSFPSYAITAGTHPVVLSGAGVNVDFLQLVEETIVTSVGEGGLPETFSLSQNYPNPFNPATTIQFNLGSASNVQLTIFNILGQKVATLVNGDMDAGAHTLTFDATNLATGVYFYTLRAGDFVAHRKMMLLK